jgi:cytochrome c553
MTARKVLTIPAVAILASAIAVFPQQPTRVDPDWAFPVINGSLPPDPGPANKQAPGSKKTYTQAQIDDLYIAPDWFPEEHAPAPQIVKYGHGDALACGTCHLMSGMGHPESADLAGQPAAYLIQQLEDFRSGARRDSARMNGIVQGLSDEEIRKASEWFAGLKPRAFTNVVETTSVPKTFVGNGRMRFIASVGAIVNGLPRAMPSDGASEREPTGNRIITVPQDQSLATIRDPHSGFTAYVPVDSIAKGEALVKTGGGGKTTPCAICHGDDLRGLGNVPRIAGMHPIYVVRQLHLIKDGFRKGPGAQLMKKPVQSLTDDDIVAVAAYLGSLSPAK